MTDKCSPSEHNFQEMKSGSIFCTKCGDFRGEVDNPEGMIAMWSGTLDTIPKGWVMCDGTQGTPDLRDKFVIGGGGGYVQGSKGGNSHCTLTVENLPSHTHPRNGNNARELPVVESTLKRHETANLVVRTETVKNYSYGEETRKVYDMPYHQTATGSAGATKPKQIDLRPPYFALLFIMRRREGAFPSRKRRQEA